MRLDGSTKKSRNRTGDGGFGLLESLIAIAILTTVSLGVAQLFAVALLANRTAKDKTSTSVLALFISALVAELARESGVLRFVEKGVPLAPAVTWQSTTTAEPITRYGSASQLDPLAEAESSAKTESSQRDEATSYRSDDMPKA